MHISDLYRLRSNPSSATDSELNPHESPLPFDSIPLLLAQFVIATLVPILIALPFLSLASNYNQCFLKYYGQKQCKSNSENLHRKRKQKRKETPDISRNTQNFVYIRYQFTGLT